MTALTEWRPLSKSYLNLCPMLKCGIFVPQLCLCQMPVTEEFICYLLSLSSICSWQVHYNTHLMHQMEQKLHTRTREKKNQHNEILPAINNVVYHDEAKKAKLS